ncbi:hypothetical protein Nocox_40440 [Nonomuraea coxensis DSM 45129]|uniref:Allene oxide cyclase barrel-like domain-containing protein n=1 Tax=Nonomuraea coxensis DSM 45129 TaxID=1122611 RepID=A0ABX8UG07_9ACTN|nr:hypothetical protein [Nonomuraea coxensis]QYC45631.1 hypothetical protein Nocox_40440 [Nonomuraea coxensis DSM 45129]
MRSHQLIAALALVGGMAAPVLVATGPALAAGSCRVDLYDIDAHNVAERDGQDELRFRVDGNLFPRFGDKYFPMRSGGDGDPADFGNPTTLLVGTENVSFNLREVTPPAVGEGDSLGSAIAHGSVCAGLDEDETEIETTIIEGDDPTEYSYTVRLKLTGQ